MAYILVTCSHWLVALVKFHLVCILWPSQQQITLIIIIKILIHRNIVRLLLQCFSISIRKKHISLLFPSLLYMFELAWHSMPFNWLGWNLTIQRWLWSIMVDFKCLIILLGMMDNLITNVYHMNSHTLTLIESRDTSQEAISWSTLFYSFQAKLYVLPSLADPAVDDVFQ